MHDQTTILRRHRFTREDYHEMGRSRILAPDARVELLAGEVTEMSPIGRRHNAIVNRLNALFTTRLSGRAVCQVQGSIALDAESEPQPDFAILKPRGDFYEAGLAKPADVLLLVEVAETSLSLDQGTKLELYARAGIGEYWVVNVEQRIVVAHRGPAGERYSVTVTLAQRDQMLAPLAFPELALGLGDFFTL